MSKVRTHYDNLKVARDAPPEVIRAAYRSLSQKYHPDRNPNDADAARIMAIINGSYEVLSDPAKRREHDLWIRTNEKPPTAASPSAPDARWQLEPRSHVPPRNNDHSSRLRRVRNVLLLGLLGLGIWLWNAGGRGQPPAGPKPYEAQPAAAPTTSVGFVRPPTAPNGSPWPMDAGYVSGYQKLHVNGLSTVTVDNNRNDSDVFVKLVALDGPTAYPVRQFFIPANQQFTVNKVRAGNYDIRYRDLSTGELSRSEPFKIEEIREADGISYSSFTMTLYKVQNGNMQTYGLAESEF